MPEPPKAAKQAAAAANGKAGKADPKAAEPAKKQEAAKCVGCAWLCSVVVGLLWRWPQGRARCGSLGHGRRCRHACTFFLPC